MLFSLVGRVDTLSTSEEIQLQRVTNLADEVEVARHEELQRMRQGTNPNPENY